MVRSIQHIIDDFDALLPTSDYMERIGALTDEVRSNADGSLAMEAMLRVIEKNPTVDLGSPGPLVHTLETFYKNGYDEKLLESLARKPTDLTVWMLNRLVNRATGRIQETYLCLLAKIAEDNHVDEVARQSAQHFLKYQCGRMS